MTVSETESGSEAALGQLSTPSPNGSESGASSVGRAPGPIARIYPALGNSHFRLFWLGMLPATLAWQMNMIVGPFAAFSLTGRATILGVVSLASGLPMLALALPAGVVADRFPRRSVLLVTQSTLCSAATVLAVLSLTGRLQVWQLIVASAVQGAAITFNMPARQSYLADIVGPSLLRNAVALNNAGLNFTRIAGPSLAGALLAVPFIGTGGVFAAMAIAYVAVLVSLFRLPELPAPMSRGRASNPLEQMLEGLRYVLSSRVILALLAMGFIATLFGTPYQTLMPVFAGKVFRVGGGGLGMLMAASGVGAFAGSLLVASLSRAARPAVLQLGFGVGFGLALVGFSMAPSFVVAVGVLTLVGFCSSAYSVLNNTLVVVNADTKYYGRVMSVYLLTFAMTPLGAMPLAWLADHAGAPAAEALAGSLVATFVAGVGLLYPAYRRIK